MSLEDMTTPPGGHYAHAEPAAAGHGAHGAAHGGHEEASALHTYREKAKAISRAADTIELNHQDAYTVAARKHLTGKDGLIDLTKLNEEETQEHMADTMADTYKKHAKEYFKIGEKIDLEDHQVDLLLSAYVRTTKAQLKNEIQNRGDEFTLALYRQMTTSVRQQVYQTMLPSASAHIKREHLPAVVKEMGLEDRIDASKLSVDEAVGLMSEYHRTDGAGVAESRYKNLVAYKKSAKAASGHHASPGGHDDAGHHGDTAGHGDAHDSGHEEAAEEHHAEPAGAGHGGGHH